MAKLKRIFLKIISVYEVLGGLVGVFVVLFSILPILVKRGYHPNIIFLYFALVIFLILFVLSVLGGVLLWGNKNLGYLFSFIVQLFQIPYIITSSVVYLLVAGASIAPYISSRDMGFTFYIGGKFLFYMGHAVLGYRFGINLIALLFAISIFIAWKRFKLSHGH